VEVLVGPGKTRFLVHKDKLLQRSTFFKAACSERWQQSGSKAIELPEDIPDIFEIYIHCVYHDKVDVGDLSQRIGEESATWDDENMSFNRLIHTWALADKLGDLMSTNALMDFLADYSDRTGFVPGGKLSAIAYEMSTEGSCMRQLIVDQYVYEREKIALEDAEQYGEQLTAFVLDVFAEDARAKAENGWKTIAEVYNEGFTLKHRCRYRQHDADHPSCGRDCEKETAK
jgi:hypothetical protein